MRSIIINLCTYFCVAFSLTAWAEEGKFDGTWSIDLRSNDERKRDVECGIATFELTQTENKITGNHVFSIPGCGRINEGGEGTVKGLIIEKTAVLVVTSGRNGAVVMGTATINRGSLFWQTLEEIRRGEPDGDSPLILGKGLLIRRK